MRKDMSFEQIKEQAVLDFKRLIELTEHGVLGYTYFKNSMTVLTNSLLSALTEEHKPNRTRGTDA